MAKGKRRVRRSVLWVFYVLLASAVCAATIFVCKQFNQKKPEKEVVTSVVEEKEEEKKEPVTTSATMFMVGDSLLHTTIEADALQPDGSYHFTLLDRIGAIAQNYDLRYYNQETILGGDELGIHGYPTFNGPQAWGDYMMSLGFNMVSSANNHSLDMGVGGLKTSVAYWKTKENIAFSGTYTSQEDYDAIPVYEVNGITYAFISYTYGMNGFQNPADEPYLVACYEGREEELLQKIRDAKQKADVVITAIHWGNEYQTTPSEFQTTFAQQLSDAGADIIVGNHPHCIQPVQWINGNKTICFYAMGNICAAQFDLSRIEMMGGLTIEKTTQPDGTVDIAIKDVKADLMYCYFTDGSIRNFDVIPFTQMDDAHLANYQAVYEQYKPIITQMDSTIQVGGFE